MEEVFQNKEWKIFRTKKAILTSKEIEEENSKLKIPLPEMIFGHNMIKIEHIKSKWSILFNGLDGLDRVNKHGTSGSLLKVSYADSWIKSRNYGNNNNNNRIINPFDWTYTTDYKGTENISKSDGKKLERSGKFEIPIEKLKKPDPILFYDEIPLFEDELGDNGTSELFLKIRIMPKRMLLLCRFFLRVDNVLFRIRDTRLFIEFDSNLVIREYIEKESDFNNLLSKIDSNVDDVGSLLRNSDWVSSQLGVKRREVDSLELA